MPVQKPSNSPASSPASPIRHDPIPAKQLSLLQRIINLIKNLFGFSTQTKSEHPGLGAAGHHVSAEDAKPKKPTSRKTKRVAAPLTERPQQKAAAAARAKKPDIAPNPVISQSEQSSPVSRSPKASSATPKPVQAPTMKKRAPALATAQKQQVEKFKESFYPIFSAFHLAVTETHRDQIFNNQYRPLLDEILRIGGNTENTLMDYLEEKIGENPNTASYFKRRQKTTTNSTVQQPSRITPPTPTSMAKPHSTQTKTTSSSKATRTPPSTANPKPHIPASLSTTTTPPAISRKDPQPRSSANNRQGTPRPQVTPRRSPPAALHPDKFSFFETYKEQASYSQSLKEIDTILSRRNREDKNELKKEFETALKQLPQDIRDEIRSNFNAMFSTR